jgi:hypothetical protein
VIVFLVGLLILASLVAVVFRRTARTRRELDRLLGNVRTSTARLRLGNRETSTARDREPAAGVGRIVSVPTKGE